MGKFVYKNRKFNNTRRRGGSSASFFNNVVTKLVLLAVSIFLFYNVVHSINITIQKLDILRMARIEVDNLRLKNLELSLLLDNIQGTSYLEIQARDRLKLAGEEEYIFVIPEDVLEGVDSELKSLLGQDRVEESRMVYEVWLDFFVRGV